MHRFFMGQMSFVSPNQQCESTEGNPVQISGVSKLAWLYNGFSWSDRDCKCEAQTELK